MRTTFCFPPFLFLAVWEEAGFAAERIRNSGICSMLSESLSGKTELKLAEPWTNASEVDRPLPTLQKRFDLMMLLRNGLRRPGGGNLTLETQKTLEIGKEQNGISLHTFEILKEERRRPSCNKCSREVNLFVTT